MKSPELFAACVFVIWFTANAIVQFPQVMCKKNRNYEPTAHLLPGWHFFSPKPIAIDIEVYYRNFSEQKPEQLESGWKEMFPYKRLNTENLLINRQRGVRKAIFASGHQLLLAQKSFADKEFVLQFTVPYLVLLDHSTSLSPGCKAVQFRIDVVHDCGRCTVTAFTSPPHQIDGRVHLSQDEAVTV